MWLISTRCLSCSNVINFSFVWIKLYLLLFSPQRCVFRQGGTCASPLYKTTRYRLPIFLIVRSFHSLVNLVLTFLNNTRFCEYKCIYSILKIYITIICRKEYLGWNRCFFLVKITGIWKWRRTTLSIGRFVEI